MGLMVPVIAVRLERLKESRRLYLSALKHLLGEDVGKDEPGNSR
jgi:Arc/MetJ family transcription regulator